MKFFLIALLLVSTIALSGCVVRGEAFEREDIAKIYDATTAQCVVDFDKGMDYCKIYICKPKCAQIDDGYFQRK